MTLSATSAANSNANNNATAAGSSNFEDWLFPDTNARGMSGFGEYDSEGGAGWAETGGADMDADADAEAGGLMSAAGGNGAGSVSCSTSASSSSSSAGSPLDHFSSLFDSNAMLTRGSDSETLFTATNSMSGSPTFVKREEQQHVMGLLPDSLAADPAGPQSSSSGSSMPTQLPLALDVPELSSLAALDAATPLPGSGASATAAQASASSAAAEAAAAAASSSSATSNSVADAQNSQAAGAARKKRAPRKRLTAHQKQAHNKIEKRYRININTKIAKLQQIIPWVASEETAFEVGDSSRGNLRAAADAVATATPKLNKSMILEKAVDYILYLQNNERLYEMEVQRLKKELERSRTDRDNTR